MRPRRSQQSIGELLLKIERSRFALVRHARGKRCLNVDLEIMSVEHGYLLCDHTDTLFLDLLIHLHCRSE